MLIVALLFIEISAKAWYGFGGRRYRDKKRNVKVTHRRCAIDYSVVL